MGMTPRQETAGRWVGGALGLGAGAAFVVAGFVAGDVVTVLVGLGIPIVVAVLGGPVIRWLRRGDGPHDIRSQGDAGREKYVRLRHSGGNGHGR